MVESVPRAFLYPAADPQALGESIKPAALLAAGSAAYESVRPSR